MPVSRFDHIAIPTERPVEMIAFYGALGFQVPDADEWRKNKIPFFSIQFGDQKINVHAPDLRRNPEVGTSLYTRDPDGNLLEFMVYGD